MLQIECSGREGGGFTGKVESKYTVKILIEQISYLGWSVCCTRAPGHYRRQFRFTGAGANIPKNTTVLWERKL